MADDVRFTNYRMAAGRIGLAAVLVPMLAGIGILFLIDEHGNVPIGIGLLILTLPFLWYALTVPLAVTIGEVVRVRYLWGGRHLLKSDIKSVSTGVIKTRLMQRLISSHEVSSRTYKTVIIETVMGNKICVMGDREQSLQMQAAIDRESGSAGGVPR